MTEALDRYLEQCDKDYENYRDCVDQLDVDIARDDADFYRERCALCGCHLPVDGSPCPCEGLDEL